MTSINLTLPTGVSIADHAPLKVEPSWWNPAKAYLDYRPDINGAFIEGVQQRHRLGLRTAAEIKTSGVSNMAMLVDLQHDFRDGGRLPVKGTDNVVLRTCARLLNGTAGTEYYTDIVHSQDGHTPWHISFAPRWQNPHGEPLDLSVSKAAVLDLVEEKKGIFKASLPGPGGDKLGYYQSEVDALATVKYWHHLQDTKQGQIWVFDMHCLLGSDGHPLHPLLLETLAYIQGLRCISPTPLAKGHIMNTDWFGPFEPCMPDDDHAQGKFQKTIVDQFAKVTGRVEFMGVAEDFCNYYAEKQVLQYFQGTPYFSKIAFVTDGTAAIIENQQHVLDLYKEAASLGVHFLTHDEPFRLAA